MDLTIEKLAQDLKLSNREMIDYINKTNVQFNLNISTHDELSRYHYDIIRGSLDMGYMIKCMKSVQRRGAKAGVACNRTKVYGYSELMEHLGGLDLTNYSSTDIKQSLPDAVPNRSLQMIATVMRNMGYVNKTVILDGGKQGRRWFKYDPPVSFI